MNCIIVEDQPPAQRILKKYIEDMGSLQLVGIFSDALQAMEYMKTKPVDLVFLDIHLPKLSGIDFLKVLPNSPDVILTTAFSEYALESYEFNVIDYLLKPFSFERFVKAISKTSKKKTHAVSDIKPVDPIGYKKEIYVKSGYEHIKISIDSIHHISSDADYTEIVTSEKKYLSTEPLHHWLKTLPSDRFYRIHKSHIVNTAMIEKIVGNQIYVKSGEKLPIGRTYKEDFMKNILN